MHQTTHQATQANALAGKTFPEILAWRAVHQPDSRAYTYLIDGDEQEVTLTYRQLDRDARRVAALLQAEGLAGERALLLYPPGLEFISAFLGCLYASVVAIPAYPPRPNRSIERIQAIATDAQAAVVLSTASLLKTCSKQFTENPHLAHIRTIATDDDVTDDGAIAPQSLQLAIDAQALAFLQYTSGSTGQPKGVMVSHGNLLHNSADLDRGWDHTSESVIVTWLPTFHDMGLIYGVLQPLYKGIPCYMLSPAHFLQRPARWLQAISRYRGTHSGGPNFAYESCVRKISPEQRALLDLSSWRMALNGAEPVRIDTLEKFAKTFEPQGFRADAFCPGYGLAEATLKVAAAQAVKPLMSRRVQGQALEENRVVLANDTADADTQTLVGCGWTEIGTTILIVNPETCRICARDEIGEIWVKGDTVAKGYWNRPQDTKDVFAARLADTGEGDFLRTGDLGFVNDGALFVTGRLKDLLIIRGRNHYPQDIELTVEQSHPAIRASHGAAFSVQTASGEQLVVVYEVERSFLRTLDVDEVTMMMRKAISAEHQLQVAAAVLIKTGNIPKTSSGKVQRRLCKRKFLEESLAVVGRYSSQDFR